MQYQVLLVLLFGAVWGLSALWDEYRWLRLAAAVLAGLVCLVAVVEFAAENWL